MAAPAFILTAASLALGTSFLTGCAISAVEGDQTSAVSIVSTDDRSARVEQLLAKATDDKAADDIEQSVWTDGDWNPDGAVTIDFTGDTVTADGGGLSIEGSTVTITSTGTYVLAGRPTGQLIVAAPSDATVALVFA